MKFARYFPGTMSPRIVILAFAILVATFVHGPSEAFLYATIQPLPICYWICQPNPVGDPLVCDRCFYQVGTCVSFNFPKCYVTGRNCARSNWYAIKCCHHHHC
ncbi:uncharacterized protein LOC106166824 [Lingula anatina]|uniref:Uncharacterized protein LOC106166824 n=1 Tax=Lingula anatina TaxID=7574 RepID=A0A1S3ITS1_LINAN|nr:uncharacterized protein LOC106166824 [Lingula anatina]|eukprot:XP_013400934.1 uncharacterized protein LOC106166824 [Lingula anatina]